MIKEPEMIQNIFFPEKIGSFYLFTKRTVGIEITDTYVLAAVIKAHGKTRVIEQLIKEPIIEDSVVTFAERAARALQIVMEKVGSYTEIIASISSSYVIFKEITIPLMSLQRMKMIVPFEIEAALPFSLDQAVIDSFVIRKDVASKMAYMLTMAVRRDTLQDYLKIFSLIKLPSAKNGITPKVTTDLIELYGLYASIPGHNDQATLLLNISSHSTRLGFIVENSLTITRVLPGGFYDVQGADVHDGARRDGVHINIEESAVRQVLDRLLHAIAMTLESFYAKIPSRKVQKIVLCGQGVDISGLSDYIAKKLGIPCDVLTVNKILHTGHVQSKNGLSNEFIVPLACALSPALTVDVNLNQEAENKQLRAIIAKQLIAASVLVVFVFTAIIINSMMTQRSLQKEITASETEAINYLKQKLNLVIPVERGRKAAPVTLDSVNNIARAEVAKKKDIWFSLASPDKFSFLAYLQELSTRINRESLGLDMRLLTISEDTATMMLEGQVKNFEALRNLEEELGRSKMFTSVSRPQDLKFTIKITLDKSYGEES